MTDRASHIRLARVYIAQARVTPHRAWSFTLLQFAANARRRAQGVEVVEVITDNSMFGPWWRSPRGVIFMYTRGGYNGFQCFRTPVERCSHWKQAGQYVWHGFNIEAGSVRRFLRRCEYLGTEMPRTEVEQQVDRIEAVNRKATVFAPVEMVAQSGQLEMFA